MNRATLKKLTEVRETLEASAGYHPVKEIMGNLLGGFTNKMLQHGLLSPSETKDIEAYVKKIADRKYKNWSPR